MEGTRKIKALNTINSLFLNQRDCNERRPQGSSTVFKAEPQNATFTDGEGSSGRFSPGGIPHCVPSLPTAPPPLHPPPPSLCCAPTLLRPWSRSCWGTGPAFPAVVRSTTRRRLNNGDEQLHVHYTYYLQLFMSKKKITHRTCRRKKSVSHPL